MQEEDIAALKLTTSQQSVDIAEIKVKDNRQDIEISDLKTTVDSLKAASGDTSALDNLAKGLANKVDKELKTEVLVQLNKQVQDKIDNNEITADEKDAKLQELIDEALKVSSNLKVVSDNNFTNELKTKLTELDSSNYELLENKVQEIVDLDETASEDEIAKQEDYYPSVKAVKEYVKNNLSSVDIDLSALDNKFVQIDKRDAENNKVSQNVVGTTSFEDLRLIKKSDDLSSIVTEFQIEELNNEINMSLNKLTLAIDGESYIRDLINLIVKSIKLDNIISNNKSYTLYNDSNDEPILATVSYVQNKINDLNIAGGNSLIGIRVYNYAIIDDSNISSVNPSKSDELLYVKNYTYTIPDSDPVESYVAPAIMISNTSLEWSLIDNEIPSPIIITLNTVSNSTILNETALYLNIGTSIEKVYPIKADLSSKVDKEYKETFDSHIDLRYKYNYIDLENSIISSIRSDTENPDNATKLKHSSISLNDGGFNLGYINVDTNLFGGSVQYTSVDNDLIFAISGNDKTNIVRLNENGFKYNDKEIATVDQLGSTSPIITAENAFTNDSINTSALKGKSFIIQGASKESESSTDVDSYSIQRISLNTTGNLESMSGIGVSADGIYLNTTGIIELSGTSLTYNNKEIATKEDLSSIDVSSSLPTITIIDDEE